MNDLRFATLGSGSKGNASLVRSAQTTLMVDCGFSIKESCSRLEQLGIKADEIDAILVTHEHGDHSRGVARFARRYNIPVWSSKGTAKSFADDLQTHEAINVHQPFRIGDIDIQPVAVPHDAREPCQFIFTSADYCLGLLTDVGEITPHIVQSYGQCHAIMLEFNHDLNMLWSGGYPEALKRRVAGRLGHLNNEQSADLLKAILPGALRFVVAAHLSESNNLTDLVAQQLSSVLHGSDCQYSIAAQHKVSDWYSLETLATRGELTTA